MQGQGRLQGKRQWLQGQELLQGQGRLRNRRQQDAGRREEALLTTAASERFSPVGGLVRIAGPPFTYCSRSPWEMPANRFNGFTEYGIGIGLRAPHYNHILTRKPVCDWFEIISENFMIDGGRPLHILDQILEQYKVVQHGVSMYFGSAEKPNREHLRRLKELGKKTKTPSLSDHLCWGSGEGRYPHAFMPLPAPFAAPKVTAHKMRCVAD